MENSFSILSLRATPPPSYMVMMGQLSHYSVHLTLLLHLPPLQRCTCDTSWANLSTLLPPFRDWLRNGYVSQVELIRIFHGISK